MPRTAAVSVENNFSKGLITEASGLNFPENSCSETYDCIFEFTGEVSRRPGFQPEEGYVYQSVTSDVNSVAEYVWNNVANLSGVSFVVQQVGLTLYFFQAASSSSVSGGLKSDTVTLSTYLQPGAPTTADGSVCQFAEGNGKLFVTHPYCKPFYVEYSVGDDSITSTGIDIEIRDFERQEDNLDADERPSTLSNNHKYNLYNQGWYVEAETTSGTQNVLSYWDSKRSDFPSNADVWWLFKNTDEKLSDGEINKVTRGNSLAPNGHYILDPFDTDRQNEAQVSGIIEETSGYSRPSTVAFYAGRVWYSGVQTADYGDKIYFTQIIEQDNQFGKCYQQNDPTSEDNSDLLPSDGGVIRIPGLGEVIRLWPLGPALIIFSTNGIWQVAGAAGGFVANDYAVRKISNIRASSRMSFVEAEGRVLFWNPDGIYVVSPSQITTEYDAVSITDQTIKDFIAAIPTDNIKYVKGAYNPQDMLVQWLFRSTEVETVNEHFQYDRILNLKLTSEAFYPWRISTSAELTGAPHISGIVCVFGGFGVARSEEIVVDNNGDPITES